MHLFFSVTQTVHMKNPSSTSPRSTIFYYSSIIIGIVSIILSVIFYQQQQQGLETLTSISPLLHSLTSSLLLYFASQTNLTSNNTPHQQPKMATTRAIRKIFTAIEQAEGAGARVRRSIGTPQLRNFSPFLMLDHFSIKPGAGFPDHPHRGQETITYLLSGGVDHEDFAGNKGTIGPGDLQFMTAGRGIMHAEMPRQNPDGSANVGLQLWVDLPAKLKSCEPRYRDLRAEEVPMAEVDGGKVKVKVISGRSGGVDSVKDLAYTPVWILDVEIQRGGRLSQEIPAGWNCFAYVLEGRVVVGREGERQVAEQYSNVVFERDGGEGVEFSVDEGEEGKARLVLIAGEVLDQKVVQYGPFVLNSQEEVYQAFSDFQNHENGFERGKGWESEIGKSMAR